MEIIGKCPDCHSELTYDVEWDKWQCQCCEVSWNEYDVEWESSKPQIDPHQHIAALEADRTRLLALLKRAEWVIRDVELHCIIYDYTNKRCQSCHAPDYGIGEPIQHKDTCWTKTARALLAELEGGEE